MDGQRMFGASRFNIRAALDGRGVALAGRGAARSGQGLGRAGPGAQPYEKVKGRHTQRDATHRDDPVQRGAARRGAADLSTIVIPSLHASPPRRLAAPHRGQQHHRLPRRAVPCRSDFGT